MIGIYGGTFDPVHYGHLRTALEVSEALALAELRFVPCQIPPHRGAPGASAEQRWRMLAAALADSEPRLRIDLRELERPGPSYMVDTLESLRTEMGDVPLCLILGMDAFLGLSRWHRWRELFDLAHLVVMRRPGYRPEMAGELRGIVEERVVDRPEVLGDSQAGRVYFVTVTQLEISASQIRDLIAKGRSTRYLTPDAVLAVIRDERLYQSMPD
jgi:nicotinate-nucleotide adenylyltransferase